MKNALLASAMALLLFGIGASPAAASTCPGADRLPAANGDPATAAAVVCLVNEQRVKAHRRPLRVHAALAAAAAKYSARMVAEGFYSHVDPRGQEVDHRVRAAGYLKGTLAWGLGENIAAGSGSSATPQTIVGTWISSRAHRENMLMADWTEIGVGAAVGNPYTSRGATYTAEFGDRILKPKAKAPAPKRKTHRRTAKHR